MSPRTATVTVDLDAIRHNVRLLAAAAGGADLMAVVKADAYGHGAVPVARAALDAGATWLGVAFVEEGVALRKAGIDAPVLLLSEPPTVDAAAVVEYGLTPTVYGPVFIETLAKAAADRGGDAPVPVHLKVDTGMHRAGCDVADVEQVATAIAAHGELALEGLMTHLAVADEPEHQANADQIRRFEDVRTRLAQAGVEPTIVHAANSAATLLLPAARYDLVRCGIAMYGIPPASRWAGAYDLVPAMSVTADVSWVRRVGAGQGISYGLRYRLGGDANIAVVPVGYGDGVPRRLGHVGGEALIRGARRPIAGTITMDQLMVDCGDDDVVPGDEVVLIGEQGDERITALDWAEPLDTIGYEITCSLGIRLPRRYRP